MSLRNLSDRLNRLLSPSLTCARLSLLVTPSLSVLAVWVPLVALGDEPQGPIIPVGPGFGAGSGGVGFFPGTDNDSFECSVPPTPEEVRNATFSTTLSALTAQQAAELKLSFTGNAAGQYDSNQQVIVSQTGRWKSCLAKDGQTRLLYGHLVRTTIILSNYIIEGELSLAIVAAQATIKGTSNRVELAAIGISDVDVQSKLLEAKNSLGGSSLKVENFQEFDKNRSDAEQAAVKSEHISSELVAVMGETLDEAALKVVLARAFALQSIAEAYDCESTVKRFGATEPGAETAIREIYHQVAQSCQPDAVAQERSKKILGDISVEN